LGSVAGRSGPALRDLATRHQIPRVTTSPAEIFGDPEIDAVFISTRHDSHASLALAAARAGKHVFVEKPLAMTVEDAEEIVRAVEAHGVLLSVGFNRRSSPLAVRARALLDGMAGPKTVLYRVAAGALPPEHWLRDPVQGGGRLVGEGVHFFDFARFLV